MYLIMSYGKKTKILEDTYSRGCVDLLLVAFSFYSKRMTKKTFKLRIVRSSS